MLWDRLNGSSSQVCEDVSVDRRRHAGLDGSAPQQELAGQRAWRAAVQVGTSLSERLPGKKTGSGVSVQAVV